MQKKNFSLSKRSQEQKSFLHFHFLFSMKSFSSFLLIKPTPPTSPRQSRGRTRLGRPPRPPAKRGVKRHRARDALQTYRDIPALRGEGYHHHGYTPRDHSGLRRGIFISLESSIARRSIPIPCMAFLLLIVVFQTDLV